MRYCKAITILLILLISRVANAATYDGTLQFFADPPTSESSWQDGSPAAECPTGQNGCLAFDGTDDRVIITNGYQQTIKNDDTHTIMLWVYPQSFTGYPMLMSLGGTGVNRTFLELGNNDNTFYVAYSNAYRSYTGVSIPINTWTHIAFVKTATGDNGNLYINGTLQSSYTGTIGSTPNVDSDIDIGRYQSPGYYLDGRMDEIAIYSNALSQTDVRTACGWTGSACGGYQHTGLETGLISAWRFNQSSGTTAYSTTPTQTSQSLSYSDSASLTDGFNIALGPSYTGGDSVSLAEGFVWTINRYLTDSVGLSESIVKTSTISMVLSDNIGLTDNLGLSISVLCVNCRSGGTKRKHEIIQ